MGQFVLTNIARVNFCVEKKCAGGKSFIASVTDKKVIADGFDKLYSRIGPNFPLKNHNKEGWNRYLKHDPRANSNFKLCTVNEATMQCVNLNISTFRVDKNFLRCQYVWRAQIKMYRFLFWKKITVKLRTNRSLVAFLVSEILLIEVEIFVQWSFLCKIKILSKCHDHPSAISFFGSTRYYTIFCDLIR